MGYTHAAAGALAGAAVGRALGGEWHALAGAVVGAAAGLLPDIDHPGSLAGQKVPFLPGLLAALAGHRTVTHTVWFCGGLAILSAGLAAFAAAYLQAVFSGWSAVLLVGAAAFAGVLTHLTLDACTRSGVEPFAPLTLPGKLARLNQVSGPVVTGTGLIEGPLAFLMFSLLVKTLWRW